MNLVLPVAGQSSRYPGVRPKWMLTHPNGNLMLAESFRGLDLTRIESVCVIGLQRHQDEYDVAGMLARQFAKLGLGSKLRLALIESSESQPDTVCQGIEALGITGPILVKDSDNQFRYDPEPDNSVCCMRLGDAGVVDATNKSYVMVSDTGSVVNIVEKRVVSDTFCVGGYSFADAAEVVSTFKKLRGTEGLYLSHVIYKMLLDGAHFLAKPVTEFLDWGTLEDWQAYRSRFATLFVDLDGTLVQSSSQYFPPHWGETEALARNVQTINRLYESGYAEIIVTTTRSDEAEATTRAQLERIGLKYHRILFGLLHGRRIVINDYAASNPYRACDAINLARDSDDLEMMLSGLMPVPRGPSS